MSCKDTKHRDFSLTDRAHDVQHSVEGTAIAGRYAQFKIHLDSTCPFPLMTIKPVLLKNYIGKDYCPRKLAVTFSSSQQYLCRKGKGQQQVVEHDILLLYHTNLLSYPLQI